MSSLSHISLGLALLVVGITLVVANPLASSDMSRGSANNNRGPLLDKALQRASYRLSQLSSDDYLRDLNSLRDRIYLVRPFNRFPFTRKRSCFINAGMGNNCDFKDLISAASARRIWQSPNSPGKRSVSASLLPSAASVSDLLNTYYAAVPAVYVPAPYQATPDTQHSGPIYQFASGDLDQQLPAISSVSGEEDAVHFGSSRR